MLGASSSEVLGKGRDDLLNYVSMYTCQLLRNRHATELLRTSLAEGYDEGGCEIHGHFRTVFVDGRVASNWCPIFNRTKDWLDFVRSETMNPERDRSSPDKRHVGQTMLVLDGKLIELPKGIVGESLSSIVQLQILNNCLCAWVNAPKHAIEFFSGCLRYACGG